MAEPVEADGDEAYWNLAPEELRKKNSIACHRIADTLLTCIRRFGKIVGKAVNLGTRENVTEADLGAMLDFFAEQKAAEVLFKLSPTLQEEKIRAWLVQRKFAQKGTMARLSLALTKQTGEASDIQISEVANSSDLKDFVRIALINYRMAKSMGEWLETMYLAPGFHLFLARKNGVPAGTGMYYLKAKRIVLGYGTTLMEFRRQGVQRAMILHRLKCAAKSGANWAFAETYLNSGKPDRSCRNLLRIGFTMPYAMKIFGRRL